MGYCGFCLSAAPATDNRCGTKGGAPGDALRTRRQQYNPDLCPGLTNICCHLPHCASAGRTLGIHYPCANISRYDK